MFTPQSNAVGIKLHRARTRLDELDTWLGAYLQSEPYLVVDAFNRQTERYELTVSVMFEPPLYISAIIGEAVQSLRAVLDYVVWGLTDVDEDRTLSWPCTTRFDDWAARSAASAIAPDAIEVLRGYQPDTDSDANSLPQVFATLHALSIEDKHKTLVLTSHWSGRGNDAEVDPGVSWSDGAFADDEKVIAWWTEPEHKPRGGVPLAVAFERAGPGRGHHVAAFLWLTHGYIKDEVVPRLIPYFVR